MLTAKELKSTVRKVDAALSSAKKLPAKRKPAASKPSTKRGPGRPPKSIANKIASHKLVKNPTEITSDLKKKTKEIIDDAKSKIAKLTERVQKDIEKHKASISKATDRATAKPTAKKPAIKKTKDKGIFALLTKNKKKPSAKK